MTEFNDNPFLYGSSWVRADFHLHTKADKEFEYTGEENNFLSEYVKALKDAGIGLGAVTNHNKFDLGEFKALRKKARKDNIGILPGIELSVNDGANGVHTLVVFSDEWIKDGKDYINQFLNVAFQGKVPEEYEQENGRSSQDLLTTLRKLEEYDKEFFIVFAHVEASSGLWKELDGGRLEELSNDPLVQKYCLGFQKVRTHDKPDAKCRVKVQQWFGESYPAELEGSDGKKLCEIGRGEKSYLKLGELSFEAVKYALIDHKYRVSTTIPNIEHSHIVGVRFEGGLLDGKKLTFSPHLNCLIGIRGSGKSSILEALRYALSIPLGEKAQDKNYKEDLVPFVLKNGGKVIVEAKDKHGNEYEIRRILKHQPEAYIGNELQSGISIRETIISKPLYFGQKDLSAVGKGFGHDLVEKLVGEELKPTRQKISTSVNELNSSVENMQSLDSDAEQKEEDETELKDIEYRLKQFEKYGVKETLDKQVEFDSDISHCESLNSIAADWEESVQTAVDETQERLDEIEAHESKNNQEFFVNYNKKYVELKETVGKVKTTLSTISEINKSLESKKLELDTGKNDLKEEFAKTERDLVKALEDQGVTSVEPEEYINLSSRKTELVKSIAELTKKTAKYSDRQKDVLKKISSLNEVWHSEFQLVSSSLKKINQTQSALRVEAEFKGDKKKFQSKMDEIFSGHNIRKESFKSIAENYADFGEIYKDIDEASKLAKSKADIFVSLFYENLPELLSYQVPNSYKVTYHDKDLGSHSLGQRASAMMLFILSQQENDLMLIDQPEDDLDGQSIYEEVVKILRDIKSGQQFIFATHNANFPVLGDAENISACSYDDNDISIDSGSIDRRGSQAKIISIMEGGKEAFERRKSIYQMWGGE